MENMVNPNPASAWAGRRVFITGHTGFKGGWLSWWLQALGARLVGYSLPAPTQPSLYEVAAVPAAFEREHIGDVRDAAQLRTSLLAAEPEVVFHLAAQPLVRQSYHDPLETFSTNVMGTAHLLDAVRHCDSVRAVVVVTSDKCYREQAGAHRESDALGGHDPYSASKACAELVTASYRDAFTLPTRGVGVATARAGNVFGGGDWTIDRLLPDLLRAIGSGQAVQLRHPGAVRPWQHVLEPVAGYVALAERLLADAVTYSSAWNFGPDADQALPVLEITHRLLALARAGGATVPSVQVLPPPGDEVLHEAPLLRLDAAKARQQLGWQDRLTLDQALGLTWSWHQAWQQGQAMRELTQHQIHSYRTLCAATR
jgi:CDP-glucose 4,6-dehydratase